MCDMYLTAKNKEVRDCWMQSERTNKEEKRRKEKKIRVKKSSPQSLVIINLKKPSAGWRVTAV